MNPTSNLIADWVVLPSRGGETLQGSFGSAERHYWAALEAWSGSEMSTHAAGVRVASRRVVGYSNRTTLAANKPGLKFEHPILALRLLVDLMPEVSMLEQK
jgi:hypothetical protein